MEKPGCTFGDVGLGHRKVRSVFKPLTKDVLQNARVEVQWASLQKWDSNKCMNWGKSVASTM